MTKGFKLGRTPKRSCGLSTPVSTWSMSKDVWGGGGVPVLPGIQRGEGGVGRPVEVE